MQIMDVASPVQSDCLVEKRDLCESCDERAWNVLQGQ